MRVIHFFRHFLLLSLVTAGIGAIVMLLWNWLAPCIFGWSSVSYWQALGLMALSRILFGGFGKHKHWMRTGMMHHHHNHLNEKWHKMSPEERMEYVRKRRFHHGFEHDFRHDFFQHDETGKQRQDEESETK